MTTVTIPQAYQLDNMKKWDSSHTPVSYGQQTGKGYDAVAMRINAHRRIAALSRANGILSDGTWKFSFFVTDLNIDWSLGGTTAQARLTRDMYPHNFVQPAFVVGGISLNPQDYGELCEFIHQGQHNTLTNGPLMQLNIGAGGLDTRASSNNWVRTRSNIVGNKNLPNQKMRGRHQGIIVQGYVGNMQRRHTKFIYTPVWNFSFVTAVMISGPYSENVVNVQEQQNWIDVVKSSSTISSTKQMITEGKGATTFAQQNSANIFNS